MADYEVSAELRLSAQKASSGITSLSNGLSSLSRSLSGTQSSFGGLARSALAFGATYVGVNALSGAFRAVTGGAFRFQAELESTRIGLQSVVSSIDGISFEQAGAVASNVFSQLTEDALKSTATTQELFGIYQGILGPIRGAGGSMEDVREITNNTVAAASALGVDFQQAQRDMMGMSTGVAGVDNKLFRMLRSTGAIAEDAEAFNKLTGAERIAKLRGALGRFSAAADAYGRSWAGVTSTFKDIVQQFTGAAFTATFEKVKSFMSSINNRLIQNKKQIVLALRAVGQMAAGAVGAIFARVQRGLNYVTSHWDEILVKIETVVTRLRRMVPLMVDAAKAFVAVQVGRRVAGAGLGVAAAGASGAASIAGLLPMIIGALGGGGAAAGAGGGALAGAGLPLLLAAVPIAIGAMVELGIAFALFGSAAYVIAAYWKDFTLIFNDLTPAINLAWTQIKTLAGMLWMMVEPLVKMVGMMLVTFWFTAFVSILTRVIEYTTKLIEKFGSLMIYFQALGNIVDSFMALMLGGMRSGAANLASGAPKAGGGGPSFIDDIRGLMASLNGPSAAAMGGAGGGAPGDRASTVNDFRGSRIEVKQEFRDADPDRVAIDMINDISRFAEQRIQSGFVPALQR